MVAAAGKPRHPASAPRSASEAWTGTPRWVSSPAMKSRPARCAPVEQAIRRTSAPGASAGADTGKRAGFAVERCPVDALSRKRECSRGAVGQNGNLPDRCKRGDDRGNFRKRITPGRQPVHSGVRIETLDQKMGMPDGGVDEQNGFMACS